MVDPVMALIILGVGILYCVIRIATNSPERMYKIQKKAFERQKRTDEAFASYLGEYYKIKNDVYK